MTHVEDHNAGNTSDVRKYPAIASSGYLEYFIPPIAVNPPFLVNVIHPDTKDEFRAGFDSSLEPQWLSAIEQSKLGGFQTMREDIYSSQVINTAGKLFQNAENINGYLKHELMNVSCRCSKNL